VWEAQRRPKAAGREPYFTGCVLRGDEKKKDAAPVARPEGISDKNIIRLARDRQREFR